jgi:hypothetical protein
MGAVMKLAIFLFLLMLLLPYGAQLRTRYQPLPAVVRRRVWRIEGQRRVLQITYVRIG